MILSHVHLGVRYGLAEASDLDEMAIFLGAVFAVEGPLAPVVGLTPREFEELANLFSSKATAEGLMVVGRRTYSGDLVGALLAEDGSAGLGGGVERLSPKFAPIFDLLCDLDSEYRRGKSVASGDWLRLFLVGVPQSFGGLQVGHQLLSLCLDNARKRGYHLAVAAPTHSASQHILHKHGFIERARRSYRDYRFQGEAVFASVERYGGPILMDKALA